MFGILKLVVAFLLAFFIYNHAESYFEKKKVEQKTEQKKHECRFGSDKCKLCPKKEKRSIFDPPKRKEIVFHSGRGTRCWRSHQVLVQHSRRQGVVSSKGGMVD
jgi:hypothetical protein